jgi:GNAT superfamily N-acetyltransferase
MKTRKYSGEKDLVLLQDFNAQAIAVTDHCGYLHPGDIPHHIYNGNKYYDPVEIITIWEDAQGIVAWMLVQPRFKSFDAQVRPDFRGGDFEREVLKETEILLLEIMQKYNVSSDKIYADAFRGDTPRIQVLSELGWEPDNDLPYVLNHMEITPVHLPNLPEGFSYRSARGVEDAATLAEVHNAAFNPTNWTPELYQKVMGSPGYDPERELVIQAPDGSFAAFCVIWFDNLNRTGSFEPVGTHRDFHRRGFGRAIMLYGMQKMAAAGMQYATVGHFGDNEAARGLYQSLGFKPWHLQDGFTKPITNKT